MNSAISLAEKLCNTMMNTFQPEDLPPKGEWHYHQGVFLLGMKKIYEITGNQKYYDYIKRYVDSKVHDDGKIWYHCNFDDAMPSILLFDIYEKTKEEKYRVTLDHCAKWIPLFFKTKEGGFWHKFNYPYQMWLDGFYMAQTLCVKYSSYFGTNDEFYKMAYEQLQLMKKYTKDEKTGLWYHAYDESREACWADKTTGHSPEFWGRAYGWIGAALVDILEYMPDNIPFRDFFKKTLEEFVSSITCFQDEKTGLWFQVLDKGENKENWTETSCSCLFLYTISKAIRCGYISKDYYKFSEKAYEGLYEKIEESGESIILKDICVGTGVGDYEHYINRPRCENDLHGAGTFLQALAEYSKLLA